MIAEVQQIICLLASDPVTVDDLVHRLGTVADVWGSNVFIKPYDSQFRELKIIRDYDIDTLQDNNIPVIVTIGPAQTANFETFAQTFGKYVEEPSVPLPGFPRKAIFRLQIPGKPYKIMLILDIENEQVKKIFMRRDTKIKQDEQ